MLFTDLQLHNLLQKSLSLQGFTQLTDVQQLSITKALQGHDLMVGSKTGSGKTLAFAVPIVQRMLSSKALSKQDARALVLAPTRELAKQVFSVFKKLTQGSKVQVCLIVGGENYNDQVRVLRKNPEVIIASAGRMADHLEAKHCFLNGLEILVLDEADRMLELGFQKQLSLINQQADHRKRQTLWFSATLDSPEVERLSNSMLKHPTRLEIDQIDKPHEDISQRFYLSDGPSHKDKQLLSILPQDSRAQSLVFVATREDSERLTTLLTESGRAASFLHGDMLQNKRNQVIADFIANKIEILVSTDLASRGLDIRNIRCVINYDLPKHADEYVHRIGRTGRAGDKGLALSLVGKRDWWSLQNIQARLEIKAEFSVIEGLKAKFSGLGQARKQVVDAHKNHKIKAPIKSKPRQKTQINKSKQGQKPPLTFIEDLGRMPIKRKARDEDSE